MSISLQQAESGSVMALQQFEQKLYNMKTMLDMTQRFFKEVMIKDQDYGVIPGTDKPGLLKPGAEKLCELYGFAAKIHHVDEIKDRETGYYEATVYIEIIDRKTGNLVGHGVGSANTYESRYRYRWLTEKKLPAGTDIKSLKRRVVDGNYGPYTLYRMENDDLHSQWNTILKMAKKRSLVDAVLQCTQSSGIFNQGEDALDAWVDDAPEEKKPEPPATPKPETKAEDPATKDQTDLIWRKASSIESDYTHRASFIATTYGVEVTQKGQDWIISCTKSKASAIIDDLIKREKAAKVKKETSKESQTLV
jgi:hypothetical protein